MTKVKAFFAVIGVRLLFVALFHSSPHAPANLAAPAPVAAEDAPGASTNPWSKTSAPVSHISAWSNAAAHAGAPHGSSGPVTLTRDASGHFGISGMINGHSAAFLVDTGADFVSIPADQAAQYGITVRPDQFQPIMRTASGVGMAAQVHVDEIYVAGVELHNVDAVVAQGLDRNLLGQTALRQLGKVSQQGDEMVIAPN